MSAGPIWLEIGTQADVQEGGRDVEIATEGTDERARHRSGNRRVHGSWRGAVGARRVEPVDRANLRRGRQRRAGVRHRPAPPRTMALLNSDGRDGPDQEGRLARRPAVPQRAAGTGYRVTPHSDGAKSAALTVHTDAAAPWDPDDLQPDDHRQRLPVPHHARRHEARHRRAPADRARPVSRACRSGTPPAPRRTRLHTALPDADRVLRVRLRRPGRARSTASPSSRT